MATDVPRFYPESYVTDSALSIPANATGVKWNCRPGRMAAKAVVTGWTGVGSILVYLQTSHDGIHWNTVPGNYGVTITSDAQIVFPIANPVLPWFRFRFQLATGTPTAVANCVIVADAPQALGRYEVDPRPSKDFAFCSYRKAIDPALGAVAAPVYGSPCRISGGVEKAWLAVEVGAATMGTLTARVQTSYDGGLTWVDTYVYEATASLLADVMLIAFDSWTEIATDWIRVSYTPGGGWDGTHVGTAIWTNADAGPN